MTNWKDLVPKKKEYIKNWKNYHSYNYEDCRKSYNSAIDDTKPLLEYVEKLEAKFDSECERLNKARECSDEEKDNLIKELQAKVEKLEGENEELRHNNFNITCQLKTVKSVRDNLQAKVDRLEGAMREIERLDSRTMQTATKEFLNERLDHILDIVQKALKGE